jgi:anti-sigma B factor antagonist
MNGFSFTVDPGSAGALITVHGELDLHTAPELRAEMIRLAQQVQSQHTLVVDMTDLGFMDSSGLSVFIAAHKRAAPRGARIRMVNPPTFVNRLLGVTGLGSIFLAGNDEN